jgi:hypothetical protein
MVEVTDGSAIYAKQPAAGGFGGLFAQVLRRGCLSLEVSLRSVICAALPVRLSPIEFVDFSVRPVASVSDIALSKSPWKAYGAERTLGRGEHDRKCEGTHRLPDCIALSSGSGSVL